MGSSTCSAASPLSAPNVFGTVDPLGGTPLTQVGTLTIPLEPTGTVHLPSQRVLNLKVSRPFPLGGGKRLLLDMQVFNVLNNNTPTTVTTSQVRLSTGLTL